MAGMKTWFDDTLDSILREGLEKLNEDENAEGKFIIHVTSDERLIVSYHDATTDVSEAVEITTTNLF